jgi:mono/diheme cytochrome c family protein
MTIKTIVPLAALAALAALAVCAQERAASSGDPAQTGDKGIGPVKELNLGPVDEKLAAHGKQIFDSKCSACHGLDQAIAGPALGGVLKGRTPEFVMNMMLNTAEMEAKNATIKAEMAKTGMPMPAPGLTQDEARAVVEYLRTTGK